MSGDLAAPTSGSDLRSRPSPQCPRRRGRWRISCLGSMNTILVVTSDDGLFGRIARAFVNDGEITRLARGDALPRSPDRRAPFIVVDVRAHERAAVLEELPHYQSGAGPPARCVAIAQARDAARIGIITARGHEVIAAVFPDIDPLEHLLRAHLNDSSRSAAAAIACDVALRLLPRATHETLGVVFGGAFRVSLVKQLAIHHNADRTSIGKALRKVSDWTP